MKLTWKAMIRVTLKRAVLDPQGDAVEKALAALNYSNVSDVRVGKYMEIHLKEADKEEACHQVEEMCKRMLTNPVIEDFTYTLAEV